MTARPNCVKASVMMDVRQMVFKEKVAAVPIAPPLISCPGQHLCFSPRLVLIICKDDQCVLKAERVCFLSVLCCWAQHASVNICRTSFRSEMILKIWQSQKWPRSSLRSISATNTHIHTHTYTHTHIVFAWRKRIRPDVLATRQSLCGGARSSNQGLIGCQSNLIPSSCEVSRYDISGTSIHREHRALAGRQRFGSGHFSSARMSQILQSFLISVLWEEVFAKYQTCCGFRGLSNRLRCWWNSQEIFYSFFFFFCPLS